MKTRNQILIPLAALAGLALITASANAALIVNYNFGSGSAGLEGPAGGAGETWNQGTGTDTDLLDSANVSTGIDVALATGNSFTSSGATLSMLEHNYWTTGANTLTVTVPDISKTYDLYLTSFIYYPDPAQDYTSSHSTPNVTTTSGAQVIVHTPSDHVTWARNTNYVLFEGMVPNASGELIINSVGITGQNKVMPLNGFQLVETVPEPSTTALLGLGGLALIFRRRK